MNPSHHLFLIFAALTTVVHAAFVPTTTRQSSAASRAVVTPAASRKATMRATFCNARTALFGGAEEEAEIECFIVNDEMVQTEGEKPEVVCTSEPEDFAWFNGIDPDALKPTDGTEEGATECVEGASPRGTPEWECK